MLHILKGLGSHPHLAYMGGFGPSKKESVSDIRHERHSDKTQILLEPS